MNYVYSSLGQESSTVVAPATTVRFRTPPFFLRPFVSMFPRFFPSYRPLVPQCVPVQVPATGVLGRNTNSQLTVDGQTFCNNNNYGGQIPQPFYPAIPRIF